MFTHPLFGAGLAVFVSVFALILFCLVPADTLIHLMEEGQLVETLTLYAYVIALLYFIFRPNLYIAFLTRCSIILALFAMMAREADLHKYIAHMSMLKLRFWTGDLPLVDKLEAFVIILPISVACIYLLVKHAKNVLAEARSQQDYAITTVVLVVLIPLTNIADRSLGILKETFGWHAQNWLIALQTSQEEMLEMSLPLLALVAALQFRHSKEAKAIRKFSSR